MPDPGHYFAYGSNMNPARVAERGIDYGEVRAAVLHGYGLRFEKRSRDRDGAGHANVVWAPSERVEGVLFTLSRPGEVGKMDRFELAPVNYSREVVVVATGDGPMAAWTYFANAAVLAPGLSPPRWYLDHLLAGREFLSSEYFERLESIECAGE